MKKVLFLSLLLGSILFLQGCMKIETTANINDAGQADVTMTVDMSQMASMMSGMSSEMTETQDFCTENEMSEQAFTKYQNVTCKNISEYVSVLTYTMDMASYIKKSASNSGEYLINIQALLKDSQESIDQGAPSSSSTETMGEEDSSLMMAESMGFVMKMVINFSGAIISSDVGTIKGKKLTIDFIADADKIEQNDEIWVKIKKSSSTLTPTELQKIKYEKLVNFFGKRLTKLKGVKVMERIDTLLMSTSEETLTQMLKNLQKSKKKSVSARYMEAKIWLILNQ